VCRFLEPVQTRFTEKGPGVCREQPPGLEKRRATRHQLLTKLLLVVDRASLAARHVRARCVCQKTQLDRIMSLKTQLAPTLLARTTTGPRFAWQRPRLRPIDARARSGRTGLPPRSKDRLASRGSPPAPAGPGSGTASSHRTGRRRAQASVRHGTCRRRKGAQIMPNLSLRHSKRGYAHMGRNCHQVCTMEGGPHVRKKILCARGRMPALLLCSARSAQLQHRIHRRIKGCARFTGGAPALACARNAPHFFLRTTKLSG